MFSIDLLRFFDTLLDLIHSDSQIEQLEEDVRFQPMSRFSELVRLFSTHISHTTESIQVSKPIYSC